MGSGARAEYIRPTLLYKVLRSTHFRGECYTQKGD
jgi:hypothetical protein